MKDDEKLCMYIKALPNKPFFQPFPVDWVTVDGYTKKHIRPRLPANGGKTKLLTGFNLGVS